MAAISFSVDRSWVKARWVVSRVLSDMRVACPDDPNLQGTLDQAIALGGISFDLLEIPVATGLVQVLKDVIRRIASRSDSSGLTWDAGLDDQSQSEYLESIRELGEMVESKSVP